MATEMTTVQAEDKYLTMGHIEWMDLVGSKNTFHVYTVLQAFRNVVARGGTVIILMIDGHSIARRLDRMDEVLQLTQEVNQLRQQRNLDTVDFSGLWA